MSFLVLMLVVIIAALAYAIRNLLKQVEILEDTVNAFYRSVTFTAKLMRFYDDKQMFENDDEVGEVFKQLVECTNQLEAFVTESIDDTSTQEEKQNILYG